MTFNSQISPLSDTIVKWHKKKKKKNKELQTYKKRKTRCYGHKDKKIKIKIKNAKYVKNNACKRISIDQEMARQVSSIIDVDRCSCRGTNQQKAKMISIDPPGVEKLLRRKELSRSIHQVSRSCQDCDKKMLKKLDRQQGIEELSSQLLKPVF